VTPHIYRESQGEFDSINENNFHGAFEACRGKTGELYICKFPRRLI
jgi:hypothetical protein